LNIQFKNTNHINVQFTNSYEIESYNFINNILVNKNYLLKKPSCILDLDVDFINSISYNEFSSSRNSIVNSNKKFELFGGLTSRLNITSGLVLPSDVAIHIICGSKDVIHS
jgi:hypothetical protein